MTARFKRGSNHVSLVNEDADGVGESDTSALIGEEEETQELAGSPDQDLEQGLSPDVSVGRWKFWRRQRRYIVSHPSREWSSGRQVTLCGRKCQLYGINSWRAIFLVLFVFSLAIATSVVISKLAMEPSVTDTGAVAVDSVVCAEMSADVLLDGGSAVDAAIVGMLCSGVVHSESSGIGGGGFMMIRLTNGSVYAINFRETAPLAATEDMFKSNSTSSRSGGLSVAVPGELKGMEEAHKLFGKLPWEQLFQPVIDLCRNGYRLTEHTESGLQSSWAKLPENLRDVYKTSSGGIKKVGDVVTRPLLARTLEAIAQQGTSAFYRDGEIARSIVRAVNASGGIITLEDLENYTVKMENPLKTQFNGHTFYSPPSPSGGPSFLFMLSLMDLYHHNTDSNRDLLYHRLVETFKFAFAERTQLSDPFCINAECEAVSREILETQAKLFNASFVSAIWANISDDRTHNISYYHPHYANVDDSGTCHLSVLASNGDAVAVTTTVNTFFGSKLMTDTGILLNNEMDDFSSPNITNAYGLLPSNINFIRPGKRPLSSTCPTIAVQETSSGSSVSMVIGASGGSHIPTSVAQAVIRNLNLKESLSTAIEAYRVHHQLVPDWVSYEEGFSNETLAFLESRGHRVQSSGTSAVVQGVRVDGEGCVTAHADTRKQGRGIVTKKQPQCS